MNILHLADLHLGKRVNEFSMIEDQKYILQQILKIAEEEKIDVVMLCGDIYDRTIPSVEAVELLDEFLCELNKTWKDSAYDQRKSRFRGSAGVWDQIFFENLIFTFHPAFMESWIVILRRKEIQGLISGCFPL